jgi:glycosyltransferase involved in cell wall biosynthesis
MKARASREFRTPSGVTLLYVATISETIRQFLIPYATHFRGLGWRVEAAANGASRDAALLEAFDQVHELPLSRSVLNVGGWVRGQRAISQVLTSNPDIIHVHTPIASFITRFCARRMPSGKRPVVAYTAHGFHFHRHGQAPTNLLFLAAEMLAGRWTDRLVVINDEDYDAARRYRIVPAGRLVRMPGIGVDTEFYSRARIGPRDNADPRDYLGAEPGTPYFVVVGELSRRKRTADVVEALALMRHKDAIVVLAGLGREQERLEDLASRRRVLARVRFAGFVEDVRPLVGSATALVLASDREGLARAIMEALALEVPVIASTARGNRELVDAETGIIVPTGDTRVLAAAMDWLIDHPVERREMGRRGRPRMVERYDLRTLLRRHEEMYAEMLATRGTRRG